MNRTKIGITGGIGAGKSIISRIFKLLGIPVYDADTRAKWLMKHDQELKKGIIRLFGNEAYTQEGLNRTFIAGQTFRDQAKLDQLNGLVHPAVGNDYVKWEMEQESPYTLKEAALLFEAGSYKDLDLIIVVSAPEELRIERVLKRDTHRSRKDIEAIISKQWPQEKKESKADFVIYNNGKSLVIPQVLSIHEKILASIG
ncbi:MAG: dephospho-CoA kinase [Cyclobacteriaceae bacterium]